MNYDQMSVEDIPNETRKKEQRVMDVKGGIILMNENPICRHCIVMQLYPSNNTFFAVY